MRVVFVVVCCLGFLSIASRAWAAAEASAGGSFTETDFDPDEESGAATATAIQVRTNNDGASYGATALVIGPELHAYASATRPDTVESAFPTAGAEATWHDLLTLNNSDLLAGLAQTTSPTAYFSPFAEGTGRGGHASFNVSLTDINQSSVSDNRFRSFDGEQESHTAMFMHFAVPINLILQGVELYMSLGVSTKSALGPGETSTVDFQHTGYLPPIYIGDANANGAPIPQLAGLQIVGSSGQHYASTVVAKTPGDYNGNGVVDAGDYSVWRDSIGKTGFAPAPSADGNGDGVVDNDDFGVWQTNFGTVANFGSGSGGVAVGVPEPGTATLLGTVGLAFGALGRLGRGRRLGRFV